MNTFLQFIAFRVFNCAKRSSNPFIYADNYILMHAHRKVYLLRFDIICNVTGLQIMVVIMTDSLFILRMKCGIVSVDGKFQKTFIPFAMIL